MTQPDFRNLLIMLAHSATDAKCHLEYEAKHGTPPPIPLSDLLTKWRITRKGSVPNPVLGDLGDPFYQLFCKAQNVLSFFQSQRLAGV